MRVWKEGGSDGADKKPQTQIIEKILQDNELEQAFKQRNVRWRAEMAACIAKGQEVIKPEEGMQTQPDVEVKVICSGRGGVGRRREVAGCGGSQAKYELVRADCTLVATVTRSAGRVISSLLHFDFAHPKLQHKTAVDTKSDLRVKGHQGHRGRVEIVNNDGKHIWLWDVEPSVIEAIATAWHFHKQHGVNTPHTNQPDAKGVHASVMEVLSSYSPRVFLPSHAVKARNDTQDVLSMGGCQVQLGFSAPVMTVGKVGMMSTPFDYAMRPSTNAVTSQQGGVMKKPVIPTLNLDNCRLGTQDCDAPVSQPKCSMSAESEACKGADGTRAQVASSRSKNGGAWKHAALLTNRSATSSTSWYMTESGWDSSSNKSSPISTPRSPTVSYSLPPTRAWGASNVDGSGFSCPSSATLVSITHTRRLHDDIIAEFEDDLVSPTLPGQHSPKVLLFLTLYPLCPTPSSLASA